MPIRASTQLRLLAAPARSTVCLQRVLARQRRRWQSTDNKNETRESRSFKGQLYDSAAERLQRERVERMRFAKERPERLGAWSMAMSFSAFPTELTD